MADRNRRSIRLRLVVRTLAAATVVLVVAGWASTAVVDHQLRGQIDRQLVDDIEGAVLAMEVMTPEQLEAMSRRDDSVAMYVTLVVGREGVRVASAPPDAGDVETAVEGLTMDDLARAEGEPLTLAGDPDLRVVALLMADGRYLAFAAPLDGVSSAIATVRWATLLIGASALAVLGLLVSLIGRSVVRPLEEMIDAADAIGTGHIDRRVPKGQPDVESRRLAAALNAMLQRLSDAFAEQKASERELRDFVSEAAHELRTPLATVQASAEMLDQVEPGSDEVAAVARRVRSQTRRMARLVDDLVLLARLQQGAELDLIEVDLLDLAVGAVDRAAARQPAWPAVLVGSEPVLVMADLTRMDQALDDLLDNVAVHTPEGTRATVQVTRNGDVAVLRLHDDGPGMPEGELRRASERLYRGSAARIASRSGSGLGLAIVRGVIEAHGGSLELVAGEGFTAVVRLPIGSDVSEGDGSEADLLGL